MQIDIHLLVVFDIFKIQNEIKFARYGLLLGTTEN